MILLYTAPIFVTVTASVLFKERFTLSKGLSLAITLLGCFLVAGGYNPRQLVTNPVGVTAGLVAAITYGSYTILSKRSLPKDSSSTTVLYALVFGSLFLALIAAPRLNQLRGLPGPAWGLIAALALGPTLGAYALYVKALSHIEASHASIICMAEPAATAVLAYVILRERMETMQVVGAIAVIVGVLILQLGPKALAKPPPPTEKRHDPFHVVSLIASIGMFTFMKDLFHLMAGPYVLALPVQAPLGLDRFETTHITGNQLVVLIVTSPLAFILPLNIAGDVV